MASAQAAAKPRPAVPKGNPGLWVSTDDYPPSALREEGQGMTRFTLEIDATGVPLNCAVTQSSGRADLDDTACELVKERARFEPATDAHGKAVAGTYSNSVRWQIPQARSAPKPGELVANLVIEKDGTVSSCIVEKATGPFESARTQMCERTGTYDPILGADGNPVRKRIRTSTKIEYEDLP
jgi:protein TonB